MCGTYCSSYSLVLQFCNGRGLPPLFLTPSFTFLTRIRSDSRTCIFSDTQEPGVLYIRSKLSKSIHSYTQACNRRHARDDRSRGRARAQEEEVPRGLPPRAHRARPSEPCAPQHSCPYDSSRCVSVSYRFADESCKIHFLGVMCM